MSRTAALVLLLVVSPVCATELFEDTIEKTVPLNATGTFSLTAIDGSVEIYGSEEEEVKIVAVRKAFSVERLNSIRVEVTGDREAVRVETTAPPQARWGLHDRSGTVDYMINIPQDARIASINVPSGELVIHGIRGAGLNAALGNGRLISHNCFCDQNLRVETGGLDLFFDWEEERVIRVDAQIVNGNARAVIPGEASFRLHATSKSGRVRSDFTEIAERTRGGVSEIDEIIGAAPLSQLHIRAVHGSIHIQELLW